MSHTRRLAITTALGAVITAAIISVICIRQRRSWRDDFDGDHLDTFRWIIASEQAPGFIPDFHIGYYRPDHVSLAGGYLVLLLTQETGPVGTRYGVISRGAAIYTKDTYGFGIYQCRARMSSTAASPLGQGYPASGSVSGFFNYVNNSETEIDFEFSGSNPDTLWLVNWSNPDPSTSPVQANETSTRFSPFDSTSAFHTYTFVWEPKRISYYVDGTLLAVHTTNVPEAPAHIMINDWGTENAAQEGTASTGTPRYLYVDWVSYKPL